MSCIFSASKPPIRYTLKIDDKHLIKDVREMLSGLSGVHPKQLVLAAHWNHVIHNFYLPVGLAQRSFRNDVEYFAYEVPQIENSEDESQIPRMFDFFLVGITKRYIQESILFDSTSHDIELNIN